MRRLLHQLVFRRISVFFYIFLGRLPLSLLVTRLTTHSHPSALFGAFPPSHLRLVHPAVAVWYLHIDAALRAVLVRANLATVCRAPRQLPFTVPISFVSCHPSPFVWYSERPPRGTSTWIRPGGANLTVAALLLRRLLPLFSCKPSPPLLPPCFSPACWLESRRGVG